MKTTNPQQSFKGQLLTDGSSMMIALREKATPLHTFFSNRVPCASKQQLEVQPKPQAVSVPERQVPHRTALSWDVHRINVGRRRRVARPRLPPRPAEPAQRPGAGPSRAPPTLFDGGRQTHQLPRSFHPQITVPQYPGLSVHSNYIKNRRCIYE